MPVSTHKPAAAGWVGTDLADGDAADAGVQDARDGAGRHLAGEVELRVPQHAVAADVLPANTHTKQNTLPSTHSVDTHTKQNM